MSQRALIKVQDWSGPGQLWRLDGQTSQYPPILITHGTFSNALTCLPMAQYFGQDAPTYVLEWRGRNLGRTNIQAFDYHDLAEQEMVSAVAFVSSQHPKSGVHIVAHSGGGLAMILAMIHAPTMLPLLRSMTLLGVQATHSHLAPLRVRLFMHLMGRVGRHLGYWPAKLLRLGPCSEASGIMENWAIWNQQRRFTDRMGADVIKQLKTLPLPTLVIAGSADTIIAPAAGCKAIADGFGDYATFEICGRTQGYPEDFNHARLIRSRAAAKTLWPRIAEWMARH